jgi:hypothetical protein
MQIVEVVPVWFMSGPPLELAFEWLVFLVNILRSQVSNCGSKTRYPVRYSSWFSGATLLEANAVQYSTVQYKTNVASFDVLFSSFLGAFAKLRKAIVSFFLSVRPSVRPRGTTRPSLEGFS